MTDKISGIREEYDWGTLERAKLNEDPYIQFKSWLELALKFDPMIGTAMTLSTVKVNGFPSARIVLLKEINDKGLVFFTNYNSSKGDEISKNPKVSLSFFWKEVQRQVKVEGIAEKISRAESQAYFATRPRESQISAWTSDQSQKIETRKILEERYVDFNKKYLDADVPCPDHWGGYLVRPEYFEFWQGREGRLHDRFEYVLSNGKWDISRLQP